MAELPEIFSGKRRSLAFRLIGNGVMQAVCGLAAAVVLRNVVDGPTLDGKGVGTGAEWPMFALLLAAASVNALLIWQERVDAEQLGQNYVRALRQMLFDHLSRVSAHELGKRRKGGIVLRFVGDLTAIRQWASRGLAVLWVSAVMSVVVISGLAVLSPELAIIITSIYIFGALSAWLAGTVMDRRIRVARRNLGSMAAGINEKLANMQVLQSFGQRQNESRLLARQTRKLEKSMIMRARTAGLVLAIAAMTAGTGVAAVVMAGALSVEVSRGTLLAAVTLLGILVTPIRQLGRIAELWQSARISREKITELLMLPAPLRNQPDSKPLPPGRGSIEFKNVSVDGMLAAFSAKADAGSRVLIVGPHGSGKSTLLRLINRLIEPDTGYIRIDGQRIDKTTVGSLRRAVSMVSDDLPLLRGSVRMNVLYRKPDAGDEELKRALQMCGAESMVSSLPDGVESRISEGGANLSSGQRRQLMFARALVGKPRVLLIDDIDAGMDKDGLKLCEKVLETFTGTVLMTCTHENPSLTFDEVWRLHPATPGKSSAGISIDTESHDG